MASSFLYKNKTSKLQKLSTSQGEVTDTTFKSNVMDTTSYTIIVENTSQLRSQRELNGILSVNCILVCNSNYSIYIQVYSLHWK